MGTSILQLVVTDKDSLHNGPPFSFSIVAGNEEEEFTLDEQGILRSAIIFQHRVATEYVLCVQVLPSFYKALQMVAGNSSPFILIKPLSWIYNLF